MNVRRNSAAWAIAAKAAQKAARVFQVAWNAGWLSGATRLPAPRQGDSGVLFPTPSRTNPRAARRLLRPPLQQKHSTRQLPHVLPFRRVSPSANRPRSRHRSRASQVVDPWCPGVPGSSNCNERRARRTLPAPPMKLRVSSRLDTCQRATLPACLSAGAMARRWRRRSWPPFPRNYAPAGGDGRGDGS